VGNSNQRRQGDSTLPRLRTVQEAASDLCVSVHTVRAWISRRKLGSVRLGRSIRIPSDDIARLVEEGTVPAVHKSDSSGRY